MSGAVQRIFRPRLEVSKVLGRQLTGLMPALLLLVAGTAAMGQDASKADSRGTPIKVDVRLVNLNVAVTDKRGQPYTALTADNFRVYDNGMEQAIHHFSKDDVPFTMGLVLDRSGSMFMMMKEVYQAAFHTITSSKAEDEFFIEAFNDEVQTQQDFSTDRLLLEQQVNGIQAGGATALYDAILDGVDHIQQGHHEKKALLVVTDGADNASTHRFEEVLERARKESVALYVVGMFDKGDLFAEGINENHLKKLLTQLAEATGGKAYFPRNVKECEQACITIAHELRQQYALGYYPSLQLQDGSWHNVEVRLNLDRDVRDLELKARTRAGYYAPRGSQP
jgi:Ca-activated chloride channel family protein